MPGDDDWDEAHEGRRAATAAKRALTKNQKKKEQENKASEKKKAAAIKTAAAAAATSRKRQRADSSASANEDPPVIFHINKSVFFDDVLLLDKEAALSPSFHFQDFYSAQTKLADEYATKKGYQLHLISFYAFIYAGKRMNNNNGKWSVVDSSTWDNILVATQHMKSQGLKNIIVDLEVRYSRHPKTPAWDTNDSAPEDKEEVEELDESSDDLLEPETVKNAPKKRQTATVKLLKEARAQEEVDINMGNHTRSIVRLWRCEDKRCKNFSRVCYRDGADGTTHHEVLSDDLKSWNDAITAKEATIQTPPLSLKFLPAEKHKKKTTNELLGEQMAITREQSTSLIDAVKTLATAPIAAAAAAAAAPIITPARPSIPQTNSLTPGIDFMHPPLTPFIPPPSPYAFAYGTPSIQNYQFPTSPYHPTYYPYHASNNHLHHPHHLPPHMPDAPYMPWEQGYPPSAPPIYHPTHHPAHPAPHTAPFTMPAPPKAAVAAAPIPAPPTIPDDTVVTAPVTASTLPALPKKARPSTASSDEARAPPSSPIKDVKDWGIQLFKYIEWHIKQAPSERQRITDAYTVLYEEGYALEDIQRFGSKKWAALEIPDGIGRRLRDHIKQYLKERDMADVADVADVLLQIASQ